MQWQAIHEKAVNLSKQYRKCENDLLSALMEVDRARIYEHFALTSTYSYCVQVLQLSEDQSLTLIRVARKARDLPALKAAIEVGKVTLPKAKRICSVLTPDNQTEWIEKAQRLSSRSLEKEVVKQCPREAVPDRVRPMSEQYFSLQCMIDGETESLLKQAQDLLSQNQSKAVGVGDLLKPILKEFLNRHHPVNKAKGVAGKTAQAPVETPRPALAFKNGKRTAAPASIRHAVHQRDGGQCTHTHPIRGRCTEKRWIQMHHLVEVQRGGLHSAENLTTLCYAHHRLEHGARAQYAKSRRVGT